MNSKKDCKNTKNIKINVTSNKMSVQGLKNLSFAMYKFLEDLELNCNNK